ncbi:MAG TPA: 4-(cytidine 5'-diphospho)-2-C-methyl-D-erythritol kinase [Thermoleophilaceae bacterium]|nr:4-(cytidine 5'-diphospho)-2-C-methyl-D-erythritol kinase [Thermoleophilaceae bacterium]
MSVTEIAPAKVNLVLHVGQRREDGLHDICSLFATIDLADTVTVSPAGRDEVVCPGVEGPNLAAAAIEAYRREAPAPSVRAEIEKRIPVAAGLAGGSADAAAVLRALDRLSDAPLGAERLRAIATGLGSDVPSQVEPRHALVTGAGERVEPVSLPEMWLVLVPQAAGLSTAAVYREADRIRSTRERLDPGALRAVAALPVEALAGRLQNDLEPAARSLRPDLGAPLRELRQAGALAALVTGSGPTTFGVFASAEAAARAAGRIDGAFVAAPAA